eukprot:scaffold2381_cov128-Cylindrotheca_fusiformis.AAC.12
MWSARSVGITTPVLFVGCGWNYNQSGLVLRRVARAGWLRFSPHSLYDESVNVCQKAGFLSIVTNHNNKLQLPTNYFKMVSHVELNVDYVDVVVVLSRCNKFSTQKPALGIGLQSDSHWCWQDAAPSPVTTMKISSFLRNDLGPTPYPQVDYESHAKWRSTLASLSFLGQTTVYFPVCSPKHSRWTPSFLF